MSYKTSLTFESQIVTAVVEGERSSSDSMKMWDKILAAIEKHPVQYILLDMHLTGRIAPNQILNNFEKLYPKLMQLKVHIVIVDHNPDSYHDNYLSGVLAEDKNIQVSMFSSLPKANKWIFEQLNQN